MDDSELHHTHPWEARFFVGFLIMILGFIGLVLTDMKQDLAWHYWRALTVINAILCLWLSWYTQRKKHIVTISLFWRELVHWTGLLLSVYMISVFVDIGVMSRFLASLQILSLLALATFLAGVYTEFSLIIIGVVLGFFALGIALLSQYLYSVMLPVTIVAALFLFWIVRRKRKRATDEKN